MLEIKFKQLLRSFCCIMKISLSGRNDFEGNYVPVDYKSQLNEKRYYQIDNLTRKKMDALIR